MHGHISVGQDEIFISGLLGVNTILEEVPSNVIFYGSWSFSIESLTQNAFVDPECLHNVVPLFLL